MIYYALADDGKIYDLCDCGDFEAAEESAKDLGINAIWLADENTAVQWKDILSRRDIKLQPEEHAEFARTSTVRDDDRVMCAASNNAKADVARLKTCPMYEDEEDADYSAGGSIICAHCLGIGFYALCEKRPTGDSG